MTGLKFRKLGLVFKPAGQRPWMVSHAACPVALPLGGDRVRIYFGTRDARNRPHVGFVEIDLNAPTEICGLAEVPVLGPGALGHFDENGVYPGPLIRRDNRVLMYYMGRVNYEAPRYAMAIGLAESTDDGLSFRRVSLAPVLDRNSFSPWMVSTPCVLRDGHFWRMWHIGGDGWNANSTKSYYRIKSAVSDDGMAWVPESGDVIPLIDGETNQASPAVFKIGPEWGMWFCSFLNGGYKLGYAHSADAIRWHRDDALAGIEPGGNGFDSDEIAYPSVFLHNDLLYMLYSGNGYGRDGFGLAVAEFPR